MLQLRYIVMDSRQQDMWDYNKSDTIPKNTAATKQPLKDEVVAKHLSRFPTQSAILKYCLPQKAFLL